LGVTTYEFTVASVEKQIAEAEVDLAKQWKYAVHLESSGADTTEVRLLLARLEDAQLRRIQRRNMLRDALEVMARVFEPFFATKPAGLGSGLGLSQVYGFASQSEGSAVLASAPGEGTAITLFLPRADAGPAMAGDIVAQPASAQDLLHNMGFDTRWAGDVTAALAFVESDPKLALVLSDVVLPGGVSGLDLARTLRDQRPELPVILTTGYSSYASEVVAKGFALIEKPYRREVLAASLRSAIECRRGASA